MITIKSFSARPVVAGKKPSAKAVVVVPSGNEVEVTVFGDFPGYPLAVGAQVEAEIKEGKPYNGKQSWILAVPYNQRVSAPAWATQGPAKAAVSGAVKAAEITKKSVEATMERKETNMEKMATFRDATILTQVWAQKTDMPFLTADDIKAKWTDFRKWLEGKISEPFS